MDSPFILSRMLLCPSIYRGLILNLKIRYNHTSCLRCNRYLGGKFFQTCVLIKYMFLTDKKHTFDIEKRHVTIITSKLYLHCRYKFLVVVSFVGTYVNVKSSQNMLKFSGI